MSVLVTGRFLGRPPLGVADPRVPRVEEAAGVRGRCGDVGAGDGRGQLRRHALLARAWIDGGREGLGRPGGAPASGDMGGWRPPMWVAAAETLAAPVLGRRSE